MDTPRCAESRLSRAAVSDICPSDELQPEEEAGSELLRCGKMQCATDLLVLLSPSDRVFDTVSPLNGSDQSSQISIPFSDVAEDECLRKASARDRTWVNEEAMAFSFEFKKAVTESSKISNVADILFRN
jgi:hypothetical protein